MLHQRMGDLAAGLLRECIRGLRQIGVVVFIRAVTFLFFYKVNLKKNSTSVIFVKSIDVLSSFVVSNALLDSTI